MISLPWWWLWNPWGEVRRLEFELLTACTLNDRLERKFNLKHAELLEANSRLNLKLSGDDPERRVQAARAAECHER